MIDINWNIFKIKFNNQETIEFERLAYYLFCNEFNIKNGIFRFKNQTGIETEPIMVDDIQIGFQAKYYDTKIVDNKDDIIDSIKKAKRENPNLSKIYLYLNQEFSESRTKGQKDPKYKIEIETESSTIGVDLEWRVPSHVERILSLPENQYLAEYFFSQDKSTLDFIEQLQIHTAKLLHSIQSNITYGSQTIKIDREKELSELKNTINGSDVFIISGDGGCGKTAIIKDLYEEMSSKLPFYGFKAAEFNVANVQSLFAVHGNKSINDFILAHEHENRKIVLIDSAEKISDLENQEPVKEFISELVKNSWTLIFTTRHSYLEDLRFQFLSVFRMAFNDYRIEGLTPSELELLSEKHEFALPENQKLKTLIQNPFYLAEYLRVFQSFQGTLTLSEFKNSIWQRKIQKNSFTKKNAHINREKCFLQLIKKRNNLSTFFINCDELDSDSLAFLQEDEVIGFDQNTGGYFITHDIYEEWGQEILIERAYQSSTNTQTFLEQIGNSLPVRRAFRDWLSGKVYESLEAVKPVIDDAFTNDNILSFWRDEILTSLLLSDYSNQFLPFYSESLFDNKKQLFNRIIFILRVSCKEVDPLMVKFYNNLAETNLNYVFTKPKGSGWNSAIKLVFENDKEFGLDTINIILPLLEDWSSNQKSGETTKETGLIALRYYNELISLKPYYDSKLAEKLVKVIVRCSFEIQQELTAIFDRILDTGSITRRDNYSELCQYVVSSDLEILPILEVLPDYIFKISELLWFASEKDNNDYYNGYEIEQYYGLKKYGHHDYFPASAFQSPTYWLLRQHTKKTVDFIIQLTNRAVKKYFDSGFDSTVEQIELRLPDKSIKKQYLSDGLWSMYRGGSSPVTPYLLQSMHMALEKYLLEISESTDSEIIQSWLIYILKESESASLSAVVASIVLAHPGKLFNVAKVLFSSTEIILTDKGRSIVGEHSAKSVYSIGMGMNYGHKRFEQERIKTLDDPHRKHSLEDLILRYQYPFFNIGELTEEEFNSRLNEIFEILDYHKSTVPERGSETDVEMTKRILFTRIDSRLMNPQFEMQGENIILNFNPQIEPELVEHSIEARKDGDDFMKYAELRLWGIHKFEKREETYKSDKYDNNIQLVLSETKEILENLSSNKRPKQLLEDIIPGYSCAALLNVHFEELTEEEANFCAQVVLEYSTFPLRPNYRYQISDGVEVAINTLPTIMEKMPNYDGDCITVLLLILFDSTALGQYKRVCDYSIETITNRIWDAFPDFANRILYGFLKFKPILDAIETNFESTSTKQFGWSRYVHQEIVEKLYNENESEIKNILVDDFNTKDFHLKDYSLEDFEKVFSLVPYDTQDEELLRLIEEGLTHFAEMLLKRNDDVDYSLRNKIHTKYSYFILHRNTTEIPRFVQPFLSSFYVSREMASLFQELIFIEDRVEKYDQFWCVWELFYPKIKQIQSELGYQSEIIHNYLLAFRYWTETAKNWHSLKEREKAFYQKVVRDMGHLPSVFDAIVQFLNEIGSDFLNEGVFWIDSLIETNKDEKLEDNTVYYTERYIRRYIYENRNKVKKDVKINSRVINILNFLIEKGSVHAYMLREDIL